MSIELKDSAIIFDGRDAVEVFRLTSVKHALKLEKIGIQMRSGPKLRRRWNIELGLKPNTSYDDLIAHIDGLIAAHHAADKEKHNA